jgi:murein DD-endopeptidase MepM/ murein hydrolase activator NlpD
MYAAPSSILSQAGPGALNQLLDSFTFSDRVQQKAQAHYPNIGMTMPILKTVMPQAAQQNGFIRQARNIMPLGRGVPSASAGMPGYTDPRISTARRFPLAYWSPEQRSAKMMSDLAAMSDTGGWADTGMGNPGGGNWENVNRWNSDISWAVNKVFEETGIRVPANIVKAVMELESGGVNVQDNDAYIGLMQVGPGSNLTTPWNLAYARTPRGNIHYGVQELANWYKHVSKQGGNWVDASLAYFSGNNWRNPGVSDGHYTVAQYRQHIERNLAALNAGAGAAGGWGSAALGGGQSAFGGQWSGQGGALTTMFGGQYKGENNFRGFDGPYYAYGTQYGLNGREHTGLDVMVPLGTRIYSPATAKVVCVGCWRNDHITGGVGRIELELPNGHRILYDHSQGAVVKVGDIVKPGQLIGTSGGMVSPHIHLEVRVPDRTTSSGWRLVDPVAYFGGMPGAPTFGGQAGAMAGQPRIELQRTNPFAAQRLPIMPASRGSPMMTGFAQPSYGSSMGLAPMPYARR